MKALILHHPRAAVKLQTGLTHAQQVQRDLDIALRRRPTASGPTPDSVQAAKDYRAEQLATLAASMAAGPDARRALVALMRSFR